MKDGINIKCRIIDCDFAIEWREVTWHIYRCVKNEDLTVAYYDGEGVRSGIREHRMFTPDEITVPPVERVGG
jgi:hypothetical protein